MLYSQVPCGLPCCLSSKASSCNAGVARLIPGLRRSPGEGNGNPVQYPCLGNPMDRGAWQATVHGVNKSQTQFSDQITTTKCVVHSRCLTVNDKFENQLSLIFVDLKNQEATYIKRNVLRFRKSVTCRSL